MVEGRMLKYSRGTFAVDWTDTLFATFGYGVSVFRRDNYERIHHFNGMRSIHGGFFIDEDTLFVYTGEQRFFVLSVSQKKILWAIRRPRVLDDCGDPKAVVDKKKKTVYCVACGKKSLNQHFVLSIHPATQTFEIEELPHCCRVIKSVSLSKDSRVTVYSKQGARYGHLCRIDDCAPPFASVYCEVMFLLASIHDNNTLYYIDTSDGGHVLTEMDIKTGRTHRIYLFGREGLYICWLGISPKYINGVECGKYLTASSSDRVWVFDLDDRRLVRTYPGKYIGCSAVMEDMCLVCNGSGIVMYPLTDT